MPLAIGAITLFQIAQFTTADIYSSDTSLRVAEYINTTHTNDSVLTLGNLGLFRSGGITFAGTPCYGPIEADHMGDRIGHRALDSTCAPLCPGHHMERHDFTGTFKGFAREDMRAFRVVGVQWTHNRAREAGVPIPNC